MDTNARATLPILYYFGIHQNKTPRHFLRAVTPHNLLSWFQGHALTMLICINEGIVNRAILLPY